MLKRFSSTLAFLVLLSAPGFAADSTTPFDPPALYLQWQRDPSTTITVHWHTTNQADSVVEFHAVGTSQWNSAKGKSVRMPDQATDRSIHTVELTGLHPRTDYLFRFGTNSREFKFRTMPQDLSQPVRFIEGGDMFHRRDWMDQMNALAARYDPAFVVIGGDLAYANNKKEVPENVQRWYDYFESWKTKAVTRDGRLIPLLVTLGNHEVKGFWGKGNDSAPVFYASFSMPGQQGYNVLDFGNYLSIFLLDSGLTHPVGGAQSTWLAEAMGKRKSVPHLFPFYHVPGYPSVREDEEGGENTQITDDVRKYWSPIFEQNGVKISFEHHDHAFKRTVPLLAEKENPKGVVYLGDGAWGVEPRPTEPKGHRWYIAKAEQVRHFYLITLYSDQRDILAINDKGEVFDEVYQRVEKP